MLDGGKCQAPCCGELISDVIAGAEDAGIIAPWLRTPEVLALLRCGLMEDTRSSGLSDVGSKLMTGVRGDGDGTAIL